MHQDSDYEADYTPPPLPEDYGDYGANYAPPYGEEGTLRLPAHEDLHALEILRMNWLPEGITPIL